ncbi:MAG: hypothetical protein ABH803_01280 [Candidatus Micrarchaeota archaeon]
MELNLPYGPWKSLVSATWNEHPLSIYLNPEKTMLLVVFDKQDSENKGVLVLLRKPFLLEGNTSEMMQNQKKDLTIIEKIVDGQTIVFALLDATPKYLPYSQAELFKTLKEQNLELEGTSKVFMDISKGFSIKATPLNKCAENVSETLYGDPFTLFASPGVSSASSGFTGFQASVGLLGIDKESIQVTNNVNLTTSYKIIGKEKNKRNQTMQIIAENALLNSVPCIIFDYYNALSGLALPNKNVDQYAEFKMVNRPIGFPLKNYSIGSGLFIDLKKIPEELFSETIGLQSLDAILKEVWSENSSLEDLLKKLSEVKEGRELTRYVIDKAIRVIKVLQQVYPSTFAESNYSELKTPWSEGMGRVLFLELSTFPDEIKQMLSYSILESLGQPTNNNLGALIIINENAKNLNDKLKQKIVSLPEKSIAYAISGEQDIDANDFPEANATIEFVDNECFLIQATERSRFKLRPTYSLINDAPTKTKETPKQEQKPPAKK